MTGSPTLRRLVGDPEAFTGEIFGRRPHLHRARAGDEYGDLLSLDAVDEILATRSLRTPAFRLVEDGQPVAPRRYTRSGTVGGRRVDDLPDVGRVLACFEDGATIVLQGLNRWWEPAARLCRELELALTHPVQANAYVTPAGAAGLDRHEDSHDVLVLQTHGHKHWVVDAPGTNHGAGEQEPEQPQPDTPDQPDRPDTVLDTSLHPGDSLYLPRGTPHAARTSKAPSVHLTIGIRALTWGGVLRRALREATDRPQLEASLPAGFANDPQRLVEELGARLSELAEIVADLDPAAVAEEVITDLWSGRRPLLDGQLRQLLRLEEIADATPVSRRSGSVARLVGAGERLRLVLGDREVTMPARVEPAVRRLLEAERMPVAELDDLLDAAGRVVLVRRLVREGLLVAHHGSSEPTSAAR